MFADPRFWKKEKKSRGRKGRGIDESSLRKPSREIERAREKSRRWEFGEIGGGGEEEKVKGGIL